MTVYRLVRGWPLRRWACMAVACSSLGLLFLFLGGGLSGVLMLGGCWGDEVGWCPFSEETVQGGWHPPWLSAGS